VSDALVGPTWLVDGVIAFLVVEVLALAVHHRLSGRGIAPREFVLNALSGLCLMLALRAALSGGAVSWIALALTAAGMAHGADLWLRWRRR
jgi:hypothetical protein